jgi:hypothetical protein
MQREPQLPRMRNDANSVTCLLPLTRANFDEVEEFPRPFFRVPLLVLRWQEMPGQRRCAARWPEYGNIGLQLAVKEATVAARNIVSKPYDAIGGIFDWANNAVGYRTEIMFPFLAGVPLCLPWAPAAPAAYPLRRAEGLIEVPDEATARFK